MESLRRAALYGRKVAQRYGQRPIAVTIRVQTYSGNVGAAGVTVSSTADTPIKPNPKVARLTEGAASYFGGGPAAAVSGRLSADQYRVGPITPPSSQGGSSVSQLLPTGATNKRVLVLLEGDEFVSGGELYQVTNAQLTGAQSYYLEVQRVSQ